MARLVADGALLRCSMGASPSMLHASPRPYAIDEHPLATVGDHVPMRHIFSFGMCRSPMNPQVATATAAAMGALTPQPCVPATPAPWTDGSPRTTYNGEAVLTTSSGCACMWSGTITVVDPLHDKSHDE